MSELSEKEIEQMELERLANIKTLAMLCLFIATLSSPLVVGILVYVLDIPSAADPIRHGFRISSLATIVALAGLSFMAACKLPVENFKLESFLEFLKS